MVRRRASFAAMLGRRRFDGAPRLALAPTDVRPWLADAVVAGGGEIVALADAEALVWSEPGRSDALSDALASAPGIHWVQLPWAGIEPLVGVLDEEHLWTCGKGVYAEEVAEHALAMALAGLRSLVSYARRSTWSGPEGRNLLGARVTVLGGGGICESLVRMLGPFGARITVLRRTIAPMPGVDHVGTLDELDEVLGRTDVLVLALALTPATTGLIGAAQLARLPPHAWIVNVARGAHIVTDALVDALRRGSIAGAALDVFETEPLPDGHPLWSLPNCLVTPHVGNTPDMALPALSRRVTDNVGRFARGEPLIGVVDVRLGY